MYIEKSGKSKKVISEEMGIPYTTLVEWANGKKFPRADGIERLANYFNILKSELLEDDHDPLKPFAPRTTEDYTTFPVIGDVAAGYDRYAVEDWNGDTVDIPNSYLKGHDRSEFFVLKVVGDSMFPEYHDGDKVLIKRQPSMDHSGQVGVVLYNGDESTLKQVIYAQGEDWMTLAPINTTYPPKKITGADLESCRVLGVPRLLIREISD
nr:MAG TPA: Repressor protein CI [Caudoviricetes sp.]